MKAEDIAKWVIDNRYNCTTISDEEMYKIVLGDITFLLNKAVSTNVSLDSIKLCTNCKFCDVHEFDEPCKSCLEHAEYINHEWA